jgi:hypothetical protein
LPFVVLYIIAGVLAYGMANAHRVAESTLPDGAPSLYAMLGPMGLTAALIVTRGARHGFLWSR